MMWINPQTGSKKFCAAHPTSVLFSIDLVSLVVQFQRVIYDTVIAGIRQDNGRLYAALGFARSCGLEKNVGLAEIQAGLELRTIFQGTNANSVEVADFEITADNFVLVGGVRTSLPTASTRETISAQDFDPWDESFWEKGEERTGAFILVLAKDGTVLGDRVFPDMRHRSLSNVVTEAPGRFVAVGNALGDRGWVMSFDLNRSTPGWRESLEAVLRQFWGLLAGAVGR